MFPVLVMFPVLTMMKLILWQQLQIEYSNAQTPLMPRNLSYQKEVPLLVFFDLESTGLNVDEDEIVQIAAVANTQESEEFSVFVLPSVAIDEGASKVHGITRQGRQLVRGGRILPSTDMETGLKVVTPSYFGLEQ